VKEYPVVTSIDEVKELFAAWLDITDRELYTVSYNYDKFEKCTGVSMGVHFPKIKPSPEFTAHKRLIERLGQVNSEPMSKGDAVILVREHLDNLNDEKIEIIQGMDLHFGMNAPTPEALQPKWEMKREPRRSMAELDAEFKKQQREIREKREYQEELIRAEEEGREPPPPKQKRQRVDWSDLEKLHEEHEGDTEAIAEIKGCSDAAVQRMYRINGWEIKRKTSTGKRGREAQYDWSVLEDLRDKHDGNTEEIAKEIGCSPAAVERRFRINQWEIKKPKPEGKQKRRGGKRGYSAEEEQIIRQGMREKKSDKEMVADLAAAGFTRTVHAVMYCRTRKFSDEKQFAGKVKLFSDT